MGLRRRLHDMGEPLVFVQCFVNKWHSPRLKQEYESLCPGAILGCCKLKAT